MPTLKDIRSRLVNLKNRFIPYTRSRLVSFKNTSIRFAQNVINFHFKLLFNLLVAIEIFLGLVFGLLGFFGPTLKDKPNEEEGIGRPPKPGAAAEFENYEVATEVSFFLTGLVGIGMTFIGAIGLVAVYKEQKLVTKIFCIALLCVSAILFILGVTALVGSCQRGPAFKEYWRPKMLNYTYDSNFFLSDVDVLQTRSKCCGISGENVYKSYPWSCCGELDETSPCQKDKKTFQTTPCDEAGFQKYMRAAVALGCLGVLTALYLILIVFTVWLVRFKKGMMNEQDVKLENKQ